MPLCTHVMKRQVKSIPETATLHDAAKLMRDENIGFVPVCDAEGKAIGAITDRDIVLRIAGDQPSLETPVVEVMTKPVVTCHVEDRLAVAEARMSMHRTARILCVDTQGKPVGVISLSDIAQRDWAFRAGRLLRSLTRREAHA